MKERILDEDDMGWIAIRALAYLLNNRNDIELIPKNLEEITENNSFTSELSFYTAGYKERELTEFFKRLEEFNTPGDISDEELYEIQDEQGENIEEYDPNDPPF